MVTRGTVTFVPPVVAAAATHLVIRAHAALALIFGDLLRSLSGISIIHNPSQIMYKTAFLLYIMGLEKCHILPPFLVFPPFSR